MATTDERQVEGVRGQSLFRYVNEQIEKVAREGAFEGEILCECADPGCVRRIGLTCDEYDAVRATPTLFFVVPGHEVSEIERVIAGTGRYSVVEKFGAGGKVAVRLDPRRRSRGAV